MGVRMSVPDVVLACAGFRGSVPHFFLMPGQVLKG